MVSVPCEHRSQTEERMKEGMVGSGGGITNDVIQASGMRRTNDVLPASGGKEPFTASAVEV